jgi:hypothetical protein
MVDFSDERCIRWMLGEEADNEPEAMAPSEGAFPQKQGTNFFFNDHTQGLFAFIIGGDHAYREEVNTSTVAKWLAKPEIIDKIVKGTEHASTLTKNSADQRNGILGTLNHVGRGLRWMPDDENRKKFSVKEWNKKRTSHIFLSSTANLFSALRPMQSMIFDMILLALQSRKGRPVMVIADEVGEFQRSPQLRRAITMQRKMNCPIILAYQGISQLEAEYGEKDAETITDNPGTHIILRTRGDRSAKRSSAILGLPAERMRDRVSRTRVGLLYRHPHTTVSSEHVMVSPVTGGEIQSFPDGKGFLAQGGFLTPISIPYRKPKERKDSPALIPRVIGGRAAKKMEAEAKQMELEILAEKAAKRGLVLVPKEPVSPGPEDWPEPPDEEKPQPPSKNVKKYRSKYSVGS